MGLAAVAERSCCLAAMGPARDTYKGRTLGVGVVAHASAKGGGRTQPNVCRGRPPVVVGGGARLRRSRLEPDQPGLMSWLNTGRLEKEVEMRTADAHKQRDPSWVPFEADKHQEGWASQTFRGSGARALVGG